MTKEATVGTITVGQLPSQITTVARRLTLDWAWVGVNCVVVGSMVLVENC
jgi:hypothetical protein